MNLKEIRFFERWVRLQNVRGVAWAFLFMMLICAALFWLASELVRDPGACHRIRDPRRRGVCDPVDMFLACTLFCLVAYMALKLVFEVCVDFCRPLQRKAFSPALRVFLLLKRMYVQPYIGHNFLALNLVTVDESSKFYRAFTLKINGIRRFTFYQGNNGGVFPNCIFQEGALLEFSYLADSTGIDYARVNVRCEHQGQVYHGELELEADSYELRLLPKSVLEKRQ